MSNLNERLARLNDILCTVNILNWDARTQMPTGGAQSRGYQIATLMGLAREMILDPAMQAAVDEAADEPASVAVQAAIDHHRRLPAELLNDQSRTATVAGAAWVKARNSSDFSLFQPHLEKMVSLARQSADALGYTGHPYDPMVQIYEPDETTASISGFFDELRQGILPILDKALGRTLPRTDFLYRDYPVAMQHRFATETARQLGYDFDRGRLDTSVHPFEVSFTRNDVRITSRWPRNYLPMSIFGSIHEVGHALYEQGVDQTLNRSAFTTDMIGLYAVGGTSFGMHESQSRLFENHVGRTTSFWDKHYGRLRELFPEQLQDVSAEQFCAAINRVEPGAVRVEADELTYDLHIMLRTRIEMALMDGSLSVADVPAVWKQAMKDDLGVVITDDAKGCLQDVHWSSGYIGSFPTYTIGNATAAQLMAHFDEQAPEIRCALNTADTGPLRAALEQSVWQWGRRKSRADILQDLGCKANDVAPYLTYLKQKFS